MRSFDAVASLPRPRLLRNAISFLFMSRQMGPPTEVKTFGKTRGAGMIRSLGRDLIPGPLPFWISLPRQCSTRLSYRGVGAQGTNKCDFLVFGKVTSAMLHNIKNLTYWC